MRGIFAAGAVALALAGCATPVSYTNAPMVGYDKNTEYAFEEKPGGFDLTVYYARYQFIPESDAVATACKAALMSLAWELAEQRGKKIQPINEQRIKLSMGRNGFGGMTLCSAFTTASWAP